MTVLVADGHLLFADALARALAMSPDLAVSPARPTSGWDAVTMAVRSRPAVCLIDHWLEGTGGAVATAAITRRVPRTRVVVLGWFVGPHQLGISLVAGAAGAIVKDAAVDDVARWIRAAAGGAALVGISPRDAAAAVRAAAAAERPATGRDVAEVIHGLGALTRRQVEVLGLLALGLPIAEVARALSIAPGTARSHVDRMMACTGARSRVELLGLARRYGVIQT